MYNFDIMWEIRRQILVYPTHPARPRFPVVFLSVTFTLWHIFVDVPLLFLCFAPLSSACLHPYVLFLCFAEVSHFPHLLSPRRLCATGHVSDQSQYRSAFSPTLAVPSRATPHRPSASPHKFFSRAAAKTSPHFFRVFFPSRFLLKTYHLSHSPISTLDNLPPLSLDPSPLLPSLLTFLFLTLSLPSSLYFFASRRLLNIFPRFYLTYLDTSTPLPTSDLPSPRSPSTEPEPPNYVCSTGRHLAQRQRCLGPFRPHEDG